jgi:hypothetical protein
MSEHEPATDEIATLLLCDPVINRRLREVLDD